MSKWHEVKIVEGEDGQDWLEADGRTEWCADTSVASVERYIAATKAKLKRAKIIAEYKRRESAEREQAARDAAELDAAIDLDRRAKILVRKLSPHVGWEFLQETARTRFRDAVRALDADATERGDDA